MPITRFQDTEAIAKDVEELAEQLEKLRRAYEQYFLGMERLAPAKLREKVNSLVRKHAGTPIQNARLRFRLQQTVARFNTFTAHWDRIIREIDEGRYERDVFKAKLHERDRGITPEKPTPKPPLDPMTELFDKYVAAKKKCGESTKGLTLSAFQKSVNAQAEAITKKAGTDNFRFQVSVESGKTKLKAVTTVKKKK